MKQWLSIITIYFIFYTALFALEKKENQYLFLGNHNISPMIYMKNGKPAGIVVDLVNSLAEKGGFNIEVQAMDWAKAQELASQGKADALLQINKNPEREKIYDFSKPLLESHFSIFRKNNRLDINNIDSLFNLKVGVERKGYPIALLKKYPQIKVEIIASWKDGFSLLNENKLDAVIVDRWVGEYVLFTNDIKGITVIDKPVEVSFSHIAVKKGDKQLLDKINTALVLMDKDGTKEEILNRWKKQEIVYLSKEQLRYWKIAIIMGIISLLLSVLVLIFLYRIRKTNQALRQSEENLKEAQEIAKLGSWSFDINKNYLEWSDEIYNIFNIDKKKFVPSYEFFLSIIHPEDVEVVNQVYTQSVEDKVPYNTTHRILLKDGTIKFVIERGETKYDQKNIALYSHGTVQDITKIKELELQELEHQKIIMNQSKVTALGEMIGNIAHQWRQPLSVITTHTSSLKLSIEFEEEVTNDAVLRCANSVIAQAEYLSQTIDDFRTFFTSDSETLKEFNIKDALNKGFDLTKELLKNNFIKCNIDAEDIYITQNENQLIQAILNICNNAKDAITLKEIPVEDRYFFISLKRIEDYAVITFKDSGGGINEDIIDKIFEPYFTTKHKSIGIGIGLYMTHQIIKKNFKGQIAVYNRSYKYNNQNLKGVEFVIKIPYIK